MFSGARNKHLPQGVGPSFQDAFKAEKESHPARLPRRNAGHTRPYGCRSPRPWTVPEHTAASRSTASGIAPRVCPADLVTVLLLTRWHAHGAGRSHKRGMGPAEAASAQVRAARGSLEEPSPGDQRDSVPAAHWGAVAGSTCAFR
jgi:hypothetical protein